MPKRAVEELVVDDDDDGEDDFDHDDDDDDDGHDTSRSPGRSVVLDGPTTAMRWGF